MLVGHRGSAILLAASLCSGAPASARAVELLSAEAARADGRYSAHVEMRVHAPAARVRAFLTDYDHLDRLNGAIVESTLLARIDATRVRVRIRARTCFLFIICFTKTQIQEAREGPTAIHATILSEGSDFKSGWVRWEMTPEQGQTRVRFDTEMEPDFWLPPLIGPGLVKRALVAEAIETMTTIEALAGKAEGPKRAPRAAPRR